MVTGIIGRKNTDLPALHNQVRAWRFYGIPTIVEAHKRDGNEDAVGEIRYVVGWMSDQMSRMDWNLLVDGSDEWTLTLPDKTVVKSKGDLVKASRKVLESINWHTTTVRQVTTNLFVAGQGDYIVTDKGDWQVVSVIHADRDELLKDAKYKVPILWPHPADPSLPDAPLFSVLALLDEMQWLSKLAQSQSASRISMRGILGVADGLALAGGGDFWEELQRAVAAKMKTPTDVAPMMVRGALELVEATQSGMKGMSWLIPDFPYDDKIETQMQNLIQRLAYGLPIPPEILLGLQVQSRATAYQVEENSYRAHIEPPATLVALVAEKALNLLIPDKKITVIPDPTDLLARRHSVQDVKDALAAGAVSFDFYREVLDIPNSEKAGPEDIELLLSIQAGLNAVKDPADVAAEALVAAPSTNELDVLADSLATIDQALLFELGGATQQATDRAREKIGARARTFTDLRSAVDKDVPHSEVGTKLGRDYLQDAGVPLDEIVIESLAPLLKWWSRRIDQAQSQLRVVLTAPDLTFDPAWATASVDLLADLVTGHVLDTLESEDSMPLSSDARRRVMSVAGGQEL